MPYPQLPSSAPAMLRYLDATTQSPRLRAIVESAKKSWLEEFEGTSSTLPPHAPAGLRYFDRVVQSPRLRKLVEQAKQEWLAAQMPKRRRWGFDRRVQR